MNDVAKKTKHVEALHAHLPLVEDLLGGTAAMRSAGKKRLPQMPAEEQDHYNFRLKTATLFPAFSRTIDALSGKPFSRMLDIGEDASENMSAWLDDVDLEGRNLHSFAADVLEDALATGLEIILVEYPEAGNVRTRADEKAAGLRPYFVHIHLAQLLGFRKDRINGQWTLTQLRFTETVSEPDGDYADADIEQIRVLEPGYYGIHRQNADGDWFLYDEGPTSLDMIPAVPVYGQREGFMDAKPPLLELAWLNVKHWQSQSTQDTILRVARVPILTLSGFNADTPVKIGMTALVSQDPQAKGAYVEHSGAAIESGRQSIIDLEEQMRHAGAELLVDQPVKSIAQWTGEADAQMSSLKRITLDLQDALNQAVFILAEWVAETVPEISVFSDFGSLTLQEASAELLFKVGTAGGLSDETVFEELKRRGLIRQDRTWEEEQERIDAQGPALGEIGLPDNAA